VADIAASVGLADAGYFARLFRKAYHAPPTRFRQATRPKGVRNRNIRSSG
jgi:AraC-like DNA-binding protein